MSDKRTYKISGPADPHFSRVARLALSAIASEVDANIEEVDDVRLGVSELINVALDSKAKTIELAISTQLHGLDIQLTAKDIETEVQNDLSVQIFDALFKNLEVTTNGNDLLISGKMIFAE
jgi:hypothetical protein